MCVCVFSLVTPRSRDYADSIDRSRPRTMGSTTTKPTLRELHESIPISLLLSPQADCEISAQQKLSEIWQSNNPIDTISSSMDPPQNWGMASYRKMFNLYHLRWVIYCSYPLPNTREEWTVHDWGCEDLLCCCDGSQG